jgi:chemotaxis protein methyltransferase CheR
MIAFEEEQDNNQELEIQLLLEAIYLKYGYDFRNYSKAHLKRRILGRLSRSKCSSISEMQHQLIYDVNFFQQLIRDLSINVTAMFRDPAFYKAIREEVVPLLKTYPYIKIWHAGCSTGEEVYSMAILLKEEGLLDRSIIYATDFNQIVLKQASDAIYPLDKIKEYTENYFKANGKASFSDYFTVEYGSALINKNLKKNIVFSDHNLVNDGVFAEVNMIFCRNVLIYFDRELQNKVFKLFYESLIPGGILCLGTKETLFYSDNKKDYKQLHDLNIYKKLYTPDL